MLLLFGLCNLSGTYDVDEYACRHSTWQRCMRMDCKLRRGTCGKPCKLQGNCVQKHSAKWNNLRRKRNVRENMLKL
jgi:hypothetical protein